MTFCHAQGIEAVAGTDAGWVLRLAQGFREGLTLAQGAEELPGGVEVLWGGLLSFCEAPRRFREVFWGHVDAVAGYRGALGRDFLPVAAFRAVIFLPAEVF